MKGKTKKSQTIKRNKRSEICDICVEHSNSGVRHNLTFMNGNSDNFL
jgi:hypothetical protein